MAIKDHMVPLRSGDAAENELSFPLSYAFLTQSQSCVQLHPASQETHDTTDALCMVPKSAHKAPASTREEYLSLLTKLRKKGGFSGHIVHVAENLIEFGLYLVCDL